MESTFSLLIQPIGYTNQSGGRGPVDRFKLCRETENILKISKNISDGRKLQVSHHHCGGTTGYVSIHYEVFVLQQETRTPDSLLAALAERAVTSVTTQHCSS